MSFPIHENSLHVAPCVRVFYYTVSLVPVLYQHGHIQTVILLAYGIDIQPIANVYLRYRIVLHLLSKIFGLFGTTYVKRRVKIAIVFGEEIGDYIVLVGQS